MWKKKRIFASEMTIRQLTLAALALLASATAQGQYVKLTGDTSRTALYFNADRVWDYNLYEHSRWGGGLRLVVHPARLVFDEVAADASLGYGVYDEQWKYGVALTERRHGNTFYQRFRRDYFAAGSRRMDSPWSDGGQPLGSFWARRMTDETRVTLGMHRRTGRCRWAVEGEWRRRGMLFDGNRLLYLNQGESIGRSRLVAARLMMSLTCGFSAQLELGHILDPPGGGSPHLARLLTRYNRTFRLSPLLLKVYAQAGVTPPATEYADMFDLGGTYGAPVLLGNNLATARPNEFTANLFGLVSLRLRTAKPLYRVYSTLFSVGSNPVPFVGVNAAWGRLWGQGTDGRLVQQGILLQAPDRGIAEPVAGVDGLVRWGVVDWGAAVVYRLVPPSASYHLATPADNLTVLITASLTL